MLKAFDVVDHNILLNKLFTYGICVLALKRFKSYLTNQKPLAELHWEINIQIKLKVTSI
jgi:hypothetical protein